MSIPLTDYWLMQKVYQLCATLGSCLHVKCINRHRTRFYRKAIFIIHKCYVFVSECGILTETPKYNFNDFRSLINCCLENTFPASLKTSAASCKWQNTGTVFTGLLRLARYFRHFSCHAQSVSGRQILYLIPTEITWKSLIDLMAAA